MPTVTDDGEIMAVSTGTDATATDDATVTANTTNAPSFQKYKKYVPYCTNDKNTTIGMPEVVTKDCDNSAKNSGDTIAAAASGEGLTVYVGDSFEGEGGGGSLSSSSPPTFSSGRSRSSTASIMHFRNTSAKSRENHSKEDESSRFEEEMEAEAERGILNVALSVSVFASRERLHLAEDVYAFILACPICSGPFWFAVYFILVKYICYSVLLSGIQNDHLFDGQAIVQVVKFFLIPVAVAMQEDLMTVYANVANKKYDPSVSKNHNYATGAKWVLSNTLRAIDGLLSLGVNFGVMLMTNTILGIFLNFAALHFLQFIDDVLYELAEKGFFGDAMEEATILCKSITFPRRATLPGDKCNNFITNLDTLLLALTASICLIIYGVVQALFYYEGTQEHWHSDFSPSNFPTMSSFPTPSPIDQLE